MAGKNVAKVGARLVAGSISIPVIIHGLQIGVMCLVGIQCAKPIKDRTSPQLYKFFTWGVLLYTAVIGWRRCAVVSRGSLTSTVAATACGGALAEI